MQLTKRVKKQISSRLRNGRGGSNVGSPKIDNKRTSSMIQSRAGRRKNQNKVEVREKTGWSLDINMAYEQRPFNFYKNQQNHYQSRSILVNFNCNER